MSSLLGAFITSKTRIEILLRLFANPQRRAHLRELAVSPGHANKGI